MKLLIILVLISVCWLQVVKSDGLKIEINEKDVLILDKERIKMNRYQERREKPEYYLNEKGSKNKIPLKDLKYNVKIENSIGLVEMSQIYQNDYDRMIEAEYYFAISPKQVLYEMIAEIDGKIIKGIIKEKQEAQAQYDEAIKKGDTAAYAEIHEEANDFVKLKLGNIQPGQKITVILSYLEQLDVAENKFWKFSLGNPFQGSKYSGRDGFVNPDVHDDPGYLQSIRIDLRSRSDIEFIASPSHDTHPNFKLKKSQDPSQLNVYLENIKADREFILLYRDSQINKPQTICQYSNKIDPQYKYSALISFVPDFDPQNKDYSRTYSSFREKYLKNLENESPEVSADYSKLSGSKGEFVFIVDRSGSMEGGRMDMTIQVLQKALEILPQDSYFNIISFGSRYIPMFPTSVKLNSETKKQALDQISLFSADLGGTEIYDPLNFVFQQSNIPKYPKSIFLITDGQVHNNQQIISLVRQNTDRSNARVYTVGIGNGVSKELVQQVSEQGRGKYEIVQETSRLHERLTHLVNDAVSPFIDSFKVTLDSQKISLIVPNPKSITTLRKNEPLEFIVFMDDVFTDTEITLQFYDSTQNKIQTQTIKINKDQFQEGLMTHKLGFHKLIRTILNNALYDNYENSEIYAPRFKDSQQSFEEVKKLSLQSQVLSIFTAFILVKENDLDPSNLESPLKIVIPLTKSIDYQVTNCGRGSNRIGQVNLEAMLLIDNDPQLQTIDSSHSPVWQVQEEIKSPQPSHPRVQQVSKPSIPTDLKTQNSVYQTINLMILFLLILFMIL